MANYDTVKRELGLLNRTDRQHIIFSSVRQHRSLKRKKQLARKKYCISAIALAVFINPSIAYSQNIKIAASGEKRSNSSSAVKALYPAIRKRPDNLEDKAIVRSTAQAQDAASDPATPSPTLEIFRDQNFADRNNVDLATGKLRVTESLINSGNNGLSVALDIESPGLAITPVHYASDPALSVSNSLGQIVYSGLSTNSLFIYTGTIDDRYSPPSFFVLQTPFEREKFVQLGNIYSTGGTSSKVSPVNGGVDGYTFITKDGNSGIASPLLVYLSLYTPLSPGSGYVGNAITSLTKPDGEEFTYTYDTAGIRYYDSNPYTNTSRIRSIVSNRGYGLQFKYENDSSQLNGAAEVDQWYSVTEIARYNKSLEICDEAGPRCALTSPLTQKTQISYDRSANLVNFTKPNGETFQIGMSLEPRYGSFRVVSTIRGGIEESRKTINYREIVDTVYPPGGLPTIFEDQEGVSGVSQFGQTWSYDYRRTFYADGSGREPSSTMTATNPLGQSKVLTMSLASDPPDSVTDEISRKTTYQMFRYPWTSIIPDLSADEVNYSLLPSESEAYLGKVLLPEGVRPDISGSNYEISYDNRGNRVQLKINPKPGGSGAAQLVQATYLASCDNPITCNKPLSTTDQNGAVTYFTYDSTHGGITTETSPAVIGSNNSPVNRVKRYAYSSQYAWVNNGAGGYAAVGKPIWLLTEERTCRSTETTSTGCAGGAADEIVTGYEYGPNNGTLGNNLLLRGKSVSADAQTLRTCYGYDARGNPISETKPRAGAAACY